MRRDAVGRALVRESGSPHVSSCELCGGQLPTRYGLRMHLYRVHGTGAPL